MGGARDAVAATSAAGGLSNGASTSCCGSKANQRAAPLAYISPTAAPGCHLIAELQPHSQYFNNRLQRLENWSIWDVREQPSGRSVPPQQTRQPIEENPKPSLPTLTPPSPSTRSDGWTQKPRVIVNHFIYSNIYTLSSCTSSSSSCTSIFSLYLSTSLFFAHIFLLLHTSST